MQWEYKGIPVIEYPKEAKAFIYYLEFTSGEKYYGKKNLHSISRKKVIGKTRRTVTIKESNWRTYNSSSDLVKAKLKAGDSLVKREIVMWCNSLGLASYYEAYYMFINHVLLDNSYLNKWIYIKAYKSNLKGNDAS